MHELGVRAGEVHHVHGDLILGIEDVHVVLALDLLVVQAIPHVGIDEVSTLDAVDLVGDDDAVIRSVDLHRLFNLPALPHSAAGVVR